MGWGYSSLTDYDIVNMQAMIKDNIQQIVYKSTALMDHLEENMPAESEREGGNTCDVMVMDTTLGNSAAYAVGGTVTTTRRTGLLDQVSYDWKTYACGITVEQLDLLRNKGPKRANYLDMLVKAAMMDIRDQIQTALWAASTAADNIHCINDMCDGTTTLGNKAQSDPWLSTSTASGSFSAQGISNLRTLLNTLTINSKKPTAQFTSQTYFEAYAAECLNVLHLTPARKADLSFPNYVFDEIPIFYDRSAATNHGSKWFALNNSDTFLYPHPDDEFELGEWVKASNAPRWSALLTWTGAFVTVDPGSSGQLKTLAA